MPENKDFNFGGEIAWRPTPELIAQSHLTKFIKKHNLSSYDELMRKSTTDIGWFWDVILKELDVRFDKPYSAIVDLSRGPAWPQWCVGGEMNIVKSLLDKHAGTPVDDRLAIRWENENGGTKNLTYAELRKQVNKTANALRSLGLKKGDVIGVFMPMTPEIVAAMLAIIKIGGIFLPLFSGYGVQAEVSRMVDAGAKALFTSDGFFRHGHVIPEKKIADEAALQEPSLQHMIVLHYAGDALPESETPANVRVHDWHELIDPQPDEAATERTSAEDPLMIIYTSGTTGRPKGAVHTHCSFPIKAAQDMRLCFDLHEDETIFWVTDMGWMMGPWLVFGALLNAATMMIYDGALDYPAPDRLWALVERHQVTTLGISPTLIRSLLKHGDAPVRAHNLSSLRKFGSTGEPWNPEPWRWLFDVVGGGKLPIINYSGGTETSGGLLCGNVISSLKPCAFAGPIPGMAVDVVDDRGQSVRGEVGELVIRQPWIGMTRGFWKDPQRYEEAYWSRFPGVWVHGDWAAVDADGLWYILGRSDDTIKVAGKRLGPAEVESILVAHASVSEAVAIGVPDELKGQALVCFCVLKPGCPPDETLRAALKKDIVHELGKPLTPKEIKFTTDLPKTRNAKVMRRLVRCAYLNEPLGDISALENPDSLNQIRQST